MGYRSLANIVPTFLSIDSMVSYARKYERLDKIKSAFFELETIKSSSRISKTFKDKISKDETITSGQHAPSSPFNFAVLHTKNIDYKLAHFVAFGLKSYNQDNTPKELTDSVKDTLDRLFTLCPVTSFDLCHDSTTPLNIDSIRGYGAWVKCYDSQYLNTPFLYGIDRIILYDKAKKDKLQSPLWRLEFRLSLSGVKPKDYVLPIDSIEDILKLVR
jgi:hypothetical protein